MSDSEGDNDQDFVPGDVSDKSEDDSDDEDFAVKRGRSRSPTPKRAKTTAEEWDEYEQRNTELQSRLLSTPLCDFECLPPKEVPKPVSAKVESSTPVSEAIPAKPKESGFASVRRRTGGLRALVAKLDRGERPTTFERSRKDWNSFKKKSGLEDELSQSTRSKDAFVEKQEFLQRADVRQFEKEKSVRDENRRRATLNSK